MTSPRDFGIGLILGAIGFPLGYHLAARLADRHYLAIDLDIKERP